MKPSIESRFDVVDVARILRDPPRRLVAIRTDIRAVLGGAVKLPERNISILGSSLKVEKGLGRGILTAVSYLSASTSGGTGYDACPHASAECRAACLGHRAGQLAMTQAQTAQRWKTALAVRAPGLFVEALARELRALSARAAKRDLAPAVRIDGSSDTGLGYRLARTIAADADLRTGPLAAVRFYDYTKNPTRALDCAERRAACRRFRRSYRLVFSYSGHNGQAAREILRAGASVAVVCLVRSETIRRGKHRPNMLPRGTAYTVDGAPFRIVNGDRHDARFLDPDRPSIVALSLKSIQWAKDAARVGPFAVPVTSRDFLALPF